MKLLVTAIAAMLLFIACNKGYKEQSSKPEPEMKELNLSDMNYSTDTTAAPYDQEANDKKKQPVIKQQVVNPEWDKKIIKNATVSIEINDYKIYYSSLKEKIRNLGGYVAQEEQSQSDYKIQSTVVIKVPVDRFDNAVASLTTGTEKINEMKISSQDVSAEYVDTRSRIEAKKQFRNRYMDLLKQAKNMEEILSVQSEINSIQEEIESATGRLNYLGQSAAYSTINLTFFQVLNTSANDELTPTFGSKMKDAFKTGWDMVVDLFVGIIYIWPLLLFSFAFFLIYKKIRTVKPKQAE